jgi:hypothetical protein
MKRAALKAAALNTIMVREAAAISGAQAIGTATKVVRSTGEIVRTRLLAPTARRDERTLRRISTTVVRRVATLTSE